MHAGDGTKEPSADTDAMTVAPVEVPSSPSLQRLASEDIVVSAPLSFHGSAARIWRPLSRRAEGSADWWKAAAIYAAAVLLVGLAWAVVLCWYLIFGLLVVPYRLIRRGQRKRKLDDARHRELLESRDGQRD